MESGKKDCADSDKPLEGLEEATAGWDPYVSDLVNANANARREERRRGPRDKTPARRRTIAVADLDHQAHEDQD
jgi:hypothetical protein